MRPSSAGESAAGRPPQSCADGRAPAAWRARPAMRTRARTRASCRPPEDHGAGAQAAVVRDHAEAGDEADLRVGHRALAGFAGELKDRLGHAEKAAGAAGLAGRELAAAGVVREVAF